MNEKRLERVAALIHREVAEFLERRVKHPDFGFVTVTSVKLARDLKLGTIYVVCRGEEEERGITFRILEKLVPSIRKQLKGALKLRWIPNLVFKNDETFDHADRIGLLLRQIEGEEKGT